MTIYAVRTELPDNGHYNEHTLFLSWYDVQYFTSEEQARTEGRNILEEWGEGKARVYIDSINVQ